MYITGDVTEVKRLDRVCFWVNKSGVQAGTTERTREFCVNTYVRFLLNSTITKRMHYLYLKFYSIKNCLNFKVI